MAAIPVGTTGDLSFQAAASGDYFSNTGEEHLFVENTSGSTKTVRIVKQNSPLDPATPAVDRDITVSNNAVKMLDPGVHPRWYNRTDGTALLSYPDGTTGLRVAVLRIQAARTY